LSSRGGKEGKAEGERGGRGERGRREEGEGGEGGRGTEGSTHSLTPITFGISHLLSSTEGVPIVQKTISKKKLRKEGDGREKREARGGRGGRRTKEGGRVEG
jgi:hypothetical protein